MKSKLRGHPIVHVDEGWLYVDTMTPTAGNERSCGHCEKSNTEEGHDGCLGTLPNVKNACCGHGVINEAYIQYWDNNCIRGGEAIQEIERHLRRGTT